MEESDVTGTNEEPISPAVSAAQFVDLMKTLADYEDPEQIPDQYFANLRLLLRNAPTTEAFKAHLCEEVSQFVESGLLHFVGSYYFVHEMGIQLEQNNSGAFAPETAKQAEQEAFRNEHQSSYVVPE